MKKLMILFITLLVLTAGCNGSSGPSNPVITVIEAQPGPDFLTYNGHIGKEVLYIKVTNVTTACTVTLTGMTDNVDLVGYPDATFTTGAVLSTSSGGFDKIIMSLAPNSANEMFIKIDASATSTGTDFTLTLHDT